MNNLSQMDTFQNYYHAHNDNSFVRELTPDPETEKNFPNNISRAVSTGHYVLSVTTPIPDPLMITYNKDLMQ